MSLRLLNLKEEYRSDRDDLIGEFFVPCLSNCIQYDRAIEYVSLKSISTLALGLENFWEKKTKIRMVTGHRFNTADLNFLSRLCNVKKKYKISLNGGLILDNKIEKLQGFFQSGDFRIKIAIPNSEEVDGSFAEKVGIFKDENNDMVAFTGTSNQTFDRQNKNFESVDVFTSWNDKSRVEQKVEDFEKLWENKTRYVEVYDFINAEKRSLLKFSSDWAINFS